MINSWLKSCLDKNPKEYLNFTEKPDIRLILSIQEYIYCRVTLLSDDWILSFYCDPPESILFVNGWSYKINIHKMWRKYVNTSEILFFSWICLFLYFSLIFKNSTGYFWLDEILKTIFEARRYPLIQYICVSLYLFDFLYMSVFISLSQGILVDRLIDSPILYRSNRFLFFVLSIGKGSF